MTGPSNATSHTPGPWSIREGYGMLRAEVGPDSRAVATVWTKKMKSQKDESRDRAESWPEGEANARLIAAAPELLAALEVYASGNPHGPQLARDAIAKAKL